MQNPWAQLIMQGDKTVECRTWYTDYRGDLLICTSKSPRVKGCIHGCAICVVPLLDVVPFTKKHLEASCMTSMPQSGAYAWLLGEARLFEPFPVKGKLGFFDVPFDFATAPGALPKEEEDAMSDAEGEAYFNRYYAPLLLA